jgi:prepilin-type processing-associated H-X9-DG protein
MPRHGSDALPVVATPWIRRAAAAAASTAAPATLLLYMNPAEGLQDQPALRHKTGYPLTFADGHAEIFRCYGARQDLEELENATTVP